jgi:Ulp1 family protease
MRRKRIEYYDSFHGDARDFFRHVRSWLQGESKAHYNRDFDFSGESSLGLSLLRISGSGEGS